MYEKDEFKFNSTSEKHEIKCQRIHYWTQNHKILNPRNQMILQ